ncbi:MAG: type II secretion system protein N [bacterium]
MIAGAGKSNKQIIGVKSTTLIRLIEVALIMSVGYLVARIFLILVTPVDIPTAPNAFPSSTGVARFSEVDSQALPKFNPFGGEILQDNTASSPIAAAETSLNIELTGLLADGDGGGSAVIRFSDGREATFNAGEEIQEGVYLERLEPERVILARRGVLESLYLDNRIIMPAIRQNSSTETSPSASPEPASSVAENIDIMAIIGIRPVRAENGAIIDYALYGRDPDAFAQLGFVDGDIIKTINGNPAPSDAEAIIELIGGLQNLTTITLGLDRGGADINLTIELAGH